MPVTMVTPAVPSPLLTTTASISNWLLFQIWNWQILLTGLLLIVLLFSTDKNSRLTNRMHNFDLVALVWSLTILINLIMHSGLRATIPFVGTTTLVPQFVSNTCTVPATIPPIRDCWPCQRDAVVACIGAMRRGEPVDLGDFATMLVFGVWMGIHVFMFVWASGVYPDAQWRKSKWLPPPCVKREENGEVGERERPMRVWMAWSEKGNGGSEKGAQELEKGSTCFDEDVDETD